MLQFIIQTRELDFESEEIVIILLINHISRLMFTP